jgi:hypothetical protein
LDDADVLRLHLFHDEDVEIFFNGHRVFSGTGYTTRYTDVVLDSAAKGFLRVGKNTVAVRCSQTAGGQGVDVGLTWIRSDK